MEARLVRCLLLALLGAYVESEVPVKIEKIQKITMSIPETKAVEDNTLICCKAIPEGADDITLTYIPEGTPEQNFKALTPIVDTNCIQFEVSLSSVSTESDTTFEIKFESSSTPGTSLGLAQAKLVVPDITKIRADLVGKTGEVIRVSGLSTSPDEWTISDSEKNKLTCKVLSLDATLCFILNDGSFTESDVLTTCATVPNTFDTSAGATVDVCNEGEDATLPTIGPETTAATLSYGKNNMAITISETSVAPLYDVVFSHDGIIDINTGLPSVPPITASVTKYIPAVRDISIIVVSLDGNSAVVESNSTNFKDYNLKVTVFESTIEMEWTNTAPKTNFWATLSGASTSFNETEVDCNGLDNCYAYFINVVSPSTNKVQIQPYTDSTKNLLNVIVSGDVPVSPSPTLDNSRDLLIQNINLDWSSDSLTVDVEVCFQHEDAADLAQYQLVLVDSKGHWVRVQGTSQKSDGILCFSGATLDTRQFTTANKVAVLVTKRDVDGRTVLASAESHIFFITPKVAEGVSGRGNIVSWRNPGGYKFTAKRAGRPAQITTNHGSLYYFHRRTTRPDDVLVVEAVVLNVKISAVVPLTHRETAGM